MRNRSAVTDEAGRATIALFLLLVVVVLPCSTFADIIECSSRPDPQRRSTYFDDVQFTGGSADSIFAKFIRKTLRNDIKAIQSDTDSGALVQDILVCKGRRPTPSSFSKASQDKLCQNSVLFEIWVTFQASDDDDDDPNSADVNIYIATPFGSMSPNLTGECVRRNKATLRFGSAGDIEVTLKTRPLIAGFAAIGGCILAKRNSKYGRAFELLNHAECQLKQSIGNDGTQLVKRLRSALVEAAKQDIGEKVTRTLNTPGNCR